MIQLFEAKRLACSQFFNPPSKFFFIIIFMAYMNDRGQNPQRLLK